LTTSPFAGYNSLDEIYERAINLYGNADCLGTRELLSEEDELQPSGKVFRKARTDIFFELVEILWKSV